LRDRRNLAAVVAAVEGDVTGCLASATDHGGYVVATAGGADGMIAIAYNTSIVDDDPHFGGEVKLPAGPKEALNGPQAAEWFAAYRWGGKGGGDGLL